MSSKGGKIGLDMHATRMMLNNHFIRGDLRYAFGLVDYNSYNTGSATGELDWYIEARGLIGIDLEIKDAALSPYTGFGYRYLFNDARGISSTGNWGYRRESNYLYLPFGVIHRRMLNAQAKLVSTLEYDRLLAGKQISRLSDGGQGDSDVTNYQSNGYGLKLSFMYERNDRAIGPYAHYWKIARSDTAIRYQNGVPVGIGWEPDNNTIELGMKAGHRF